MLRLILRTPVVTFLLVAGVVLASMTVVTNRAAEHAAQDLGISARIDTTRLLTRSLLEPRLRDRLVEGRPQAIDNIDQRALEIGGDVVRINLWRADGTLVYSTDLALVGKKFELTPGEQRVLERGGTGYETADPDSPRNRASETSVDGLVEIYTRVRSKENGRLLFEAYYRLDDITSRREQILSVFRFNTLAPLVAMTLFAAVMLQLLTRQVRRASRERERLLRTAIEASDAERRRIARDLHDGVVQDIAGTAFTVSGLARDPAVPEASRTLLESASDSLRDGLKALRSLLAEIHPPDLRAAGLRAALEDLTAPAASAGIAASVSVDGVEDAADASVALVWRVAQEAVRNATRHSGASTLAVTVRATAEQIVLEVVDDGVGFDPSGDRASDRFGLRGMRSLVADVGGELEVTSAVGEGTKVRMVVSRR